MLCCGRPDPSKNPIVDIDALIIRRIQRDFGRPNLCERLTKKYELQVQWALIDHSTSLHKFKLREQQTNGKKIDSRKMTLFKTEFTNKTDKAQKYTFRTERQTKSTVKVSVTLGFTLGGSLNVPLSVPTIPAPGVEALNITGNLSATLNMSRTKEKSFEETLTWSVDNAVEVQKGTKSTASLIIEEEKAVAEFEMKHILTPKEISIPVYLVEKSSGKVVHAMGLPSERLYELVNEYPNLSPNKLTGNSFEIFTKGTCDVCYGAKQIIVVNEKPYLATQESIIQDDLLLPGLPTEPSVQQQITAKSPHQASPQSSPGGATKAAAEKKPLIEMKKIEEQKKKQFFSK